MGKSKTFFNLIRSFDTIILYLKEIYKSFIKKNKHLDYSNIDDKYKI